jgi:hypothetical protein
VFHVHNLLRCIKNQASIDTIARCVSLHNCVAVPLRHLSRIDGSHRLCDAITAQIRNAAAATLPALQETGPSKTAHNRFVFLWYRTDLLSISQGWKHGKGRKGVCVLSARVLEGGPISPKPQKINRWSVHKVLWFVCNFEVQK